MFIQGKNALRTAQGWLIRRCGKKVAKKMVKGNGTRSAYEIMVSDTGYGSKSRKAARMTPRRNGKSLISAVKFLIEAVGEKEASKIIAEVEKKMESDIEKDNEMDIGSDIEDIEDTEVQ